jgi:thymidylate synthase ThyX
MLNKLKCELCGNEIVNGSHKTVYDINNHEELVVCRECVRISYDIFYCVGHDRLEYDIEYSPIEVEDYGLICESLYVNSNEFHFCNECDRCFHENDLVENEYGYFCEECDEILNGIPQYHSHNYNEFLTTDKDNENTTLFGVELEVETYTSPKSVYEEIKDIIEDEFYVEKDGSLINGFEIISKPFSYNYMVKNLENTFEELADELENYINSDTNSNGMHIHMTKKNYQHTFNMVCLVEYYQAELTTLANREGRSLKRWAKFLFEKEDKDLLNLRMIESEMDYDYRYLALNISNEKTIEVRIFRASNNPMEILGRIELVANMYAWAEENIIDENFKDMPSFYEVATYKYNNGYVDYLLNKYNLGLVTC